LGYLLLGILSLYGIINFRFSINHSKKIFFLLPFFVFLSWLYGILIALISDNKIEYIFSNFLGLLFYLAFYGLLASNFPIKKLLNIILVVACFYFLYGGYLLFESVIYGSYLISAAVSVSDYRVIYMAQTLYLVPFINVGLLRIAGILKNNDFYYPEIYLPKWSTSTLFISLSVIVFIFLSMSKAFIGIVIVLIGLAVFLIVLKNFSDVKFRPIIFLLLICTFIFYFISSSEFEILLFSFSNNESSNMVREDQFGAIINEFTFYGAGLGAVLNSGYVRSSEAPYGFELTFLNLIHKLGFMVIPLFISYFIPLFYGLKLIILKKGSPVIGAFLIGAMSFIIPGYANPMLLASNFVMIHIICLYILYEIY